MSSSWSWMAWMRRTSSAGFVSAIRRSIWSRRSGRMNPVPPSARSCSSNRLSLSHGVSGLVVDAPGSSVAGAGASHGFLGRGEQVDLDAHELPQLVQQVEFGEFVPVVERVFAYDVVVAGFDGGLVVLPVGAASGLLDVELLEVGDEVRVDELAAVVVVVGADREREPLLDHGLGLGEVAVRVVAGGRVLGPSGGEVVHGQGAAELALEAGAAVGDGVGLHVPGRPSSSSLAFLIVIELRNSSPAGRVAAKPLGRAASRRGLRYRSIVEALIAMSSLNVNPS